MKRKDNDMTKKNEEMRWALRNIEGLAVGIWLAVALAGLGAAFAGGIWYESRRALKADSDFAAWNERVEREATERARAMSNQELLNATGRECANTANR